MIDLPVSPFTRVNRKSDGRFARFVIAYVEQTSEDPAFGAHGAFLTDMTEVANDVLNFSVVEQEEGEEVCRYLNNYSWVGPIPEARMADSNR